jgi:tripartite-type tricarboxylate transporter receptor subunit TctC
MLAIGAMSRRKTNRPGAGGNIGAEAVVRAPPDGYTLLLALAPNAINATLYSKLNFNFIRDIAPVAGIFRGPHVLNVNPSVPAKTVRAKAARRCGVSKHSPRVVDASRNPPSRSQRFLM